MNRGMRRVEVAAAVLAAGALLAACGGHSAQPVGGNGAGVAPHPTPASTTTAPLSYSSGGIQSNANQSPNSQSDWATAPPNSPLGVAQRYNDAEYTTIYSDLFAPNGYLASVVALKPYCTPQVYAHLAAQQQEAIRMGRNSPQLAIWRQMVSEKIDLEVDQIRIARVDEAGYTATSEWVNVVYRTVTDYGTTSGTGSSQLGPITTEQYHVSDVSGTWLVDQLPNQAPQAG